MYETPTAYAAAVEISESPMFDLNDATPVMPLGINSAGFKFDTGADDGWQIEVRVHRVRK